MSHRFSLLIITAVALFGAATSAEAQGSWMSADAGSVRFKLGLFEPAADSSYWDEKFEIWTGEPQNLRDLAWGIDGLWMFTPTTGLKLGSLFYDGNARQAYREWVDSEGRSVAHWTELKTSELTLAFVYRPLTGSFVRPYVGVGGGFVFWQLTESGDFIDFGVDDGEIFTATYRDEGSDPIAFVEVGFDVFAWPQWTFFVEGRLSTGDASLGGGFADLDQRLDLSGGSLYAGFAKLF